jgi:hypothetical protein
MKFKCESVVVTVIGFTFLVLLVLPAGSLAQEQADTSHVQSRLQERIMEDTGLDEGQMNWYGPLIRKALSLNGNDPVQVRSMFQKAVEDECVGDCLMERLRTWNRTMERKREHLSDDNQLAAQERATEGSQDMTGDQLQDRTREQSRDMSGGSGGDPDHGGGPGAKGR